MFFIWVWRKKNEGRKGRLGLIFIWVWRKKNEGRKGRTGEGRTRNELKCLKLELILNPP